MNIDVLELLARTDPSTFVRSMQTLGFKMNGKANTDPLNTQVQESTIDSISSFITEDINDASRENHLMAKARKLAERYGYIVGY